MCETVAFARADFRVLWSGPTDALLPVDAGDGWLLMFGEDGPGVFDVAERRLLWHRQAEQVFSWRQRLLVYDGQKAAVLDPRTGVTVEELPLPGAPLIVTKGCLLCGIRGEEGGVVCIDGDSFKTLWRDDTGDLLKRQYGVDSIGGNFVMGSLGDRAVITTGDGHVFCLSLANGKLLWKADVSVPYYTPLVARGRIPILTVSMKGNDYVLLDERTGEVLVNRHHDGLAGMIHQQTGSMWGEDKVVFTSESGHIALIDIESGDLLAVEKTKEVLWGSKIVDGRLVVPTGTGALLVYELSK